MWCMRYSMTGFPPYPVILATPVITAIGCDDRGDGNPEEQRQPPWAFTQQDGSSLPVTLFYWIPEQARE